MEDLLVDIKVYSDLELGINGDYWRDITIVTEDELKKLQKLDKNSRGKLTIIQKPELLRSRDRTDRICI